MREAFQPERERDVFPGWGWGGWGWGVVVLEEGHEDSKKKKLLLLFYECLIVPRQLKKTSLSIHPSIQHAVSHGYEDLIEELNCYLLIVWGPKLNYSLFQGS